MPICLLSFLNGSGVDFCFFFGSLTILCFCVLKLGNQWLSMIQMEISGLRPLMRIIVQVIDVLLRGFLAA